jgi:hypothetical protein
MRHLFWCVTLTAAAWAAPQWGVAGETEDTDTAQRVAKSLRDSGRVKDYRIGVKCKDGSVWLAGSVTSDKQMQAALEVATETQGVQRIINNLEVKRGAKPAAPATSGLVSQASAQTPLPMAAAAKALPPTAAAEAPAAPAQAQAAPAARKTAKSKRNVAVYRGVPTGYQEVQAPEAVAQPQMQAQGMPGRPLPMYGGQQGVYPASAYGMGVHGGAYGPGGAPTPAYDTPSMPNYAWPSYAAYPNYAAVTYPKQYSASAWPFIGPFHPYPQVPLGWRKVTLEWDDGWWFLDFEDRCYQ